MIPLTDETLQQVKARGAFYTPRELTAFLAAWAIRDTDDRTLEPSCGDGSFLSAASIRYADLGADRLAGRLFGIELEEQEAAKSRALVPGAAITTSSFFDVEPDALAPMDAVIGNPPYIRYHGFTGENRERGLARARAQGVGLTQLASSWAHFVVHATAFLSADGGRLGLVLPAELLHTDYAEPVREFLLKRFRSVVIVAFDSNVFDDAEVDAILLLASNDDEGGFRLIRLPSVADLGQLDFARPTTHIAEHEARRWSSWIDEPARLVYLDLCANPAIQRLSAIGTVDIGVVTGAGKFFVLTDEQVARLGLPESVLTPVVQRGGDVPGLEVHPGETRWLLDLQGKGEPTDPNLLAYIRQGEADGVNLGYKCRTRTPWYAVPLPKKLPVAFLPYMNHRTPRLIANPSGAWSTNVVHGVCLKPEAPSPRVLAVAMLSAATWLSAEIEGRAYGGGVLKLETKEAERLIVPALTDKQARTLFSDFPSLDALVRGGSIEAASAIVDKRLGLDHVALVGAYTALRTRRQERKSNQ
jgi:adenine-specific DNA methylase